MTSFNEETSKDWQNDSTQGKKLHKEEKTSQNLSTSPRNEKKCYTCNLHPFNEFIWEQVICGPWLISKIK